MKSLLQDCKFLTVRVIVAISLSLACNCPSSLSTLASNLDMSDNSLYSEKEKLKKKDRRYHSEY